MVNETKAQIRTRSLERWQLEWTSAETGRKTFDLLPSILDRQELKHLNDIDHGVFQILTRVAMGPSRVT